MSASCQKRGTQAARSAVPGRGVVRQRGCVPTGVRALAGAHLQVYSGIFAGKNQVMGVQWMYAYDHLCCREYAVMVTAGMCS